MTDKIFSTTIDGMIQASVEVFPEAVALLAPQRIPCSYQTLHTHLKKIGSDLQGLGIGSRDCVVVSLPNGPEMASVFLGVARVAICAPLNPGYREAECDFYLSDLSPKVLIVQAGRDPAQDPVQKVAKQKGIPILELYSEPEYPAGQFDLLGSIPNPEQSSRLSGSEDIALILHTSGTTSRPKMVPLTHYNLCLSAQNIAHTLKLTPKDRCLNIMPLFHIHGLVACLLSSLQVGSSVICTSGFQGDQILSWIREYQPTWYSAVPTMHQIILSQVQTHGNPGHSLRFLRSSSSTMPARILGEIEATFGIPLIEAYSMTEASHQMTTNPLPPDPRKLRSVGIPGQTQVAIADPDQNRLLAQGELGEVVIQGRSVTKGYLNNPEANAKSFFEGWFRTGDQGYLDQDGYLFLQGRLKEIVNRGGEKVSPIEVDEALMDFPEVYQAVTFAVPHPTLGEDLAVAIVLNPGIQITPEALRIRLFSLLADFKVPSQMIFVESIPKGATGKLSRMGLADKLASSLKTTFAPPQTEIEKGIAGIIQDVLQCEPVGILDNFFALGGDSLKGTQVTSRINDRYRLSLRNTILFRYPTIQELAPEIEKLTEEDPVLADLMIEFKTLSPEEIDHLLAEVENQYSNPHGE